MNKKTEFAKRLNEEGNHQTSLIIRKYIESLIEDVHEAMENHENDIQELRGEIKAYRKLNKLLSPIDAEIKKP